MYEGIRQIFICEKGYLNQVTPQGVVAWGLGNLGSLIYEDVPVIGENDEDFPNQVNFKMKCNSLQSRISDLDWLKEFCRQGAIDCQIVTEKEGASTYGGVYDFVYTGSPGPDKYMGLDFEWVESSKERYLSLMGEVSLPMELAKEIMQSALVNTPIDLEALGYGNRGKRSVFYKNPYFKGLYSIIDDEEDLIVSGSEVIDYKFTVKTLSNKLDYDRANVTFVNINLVVTVNKAKGYDLMVWYNKKADHGIKFVSRIPGANSTFVLEEGLVWRKHKVNIDNKNRTIELSWNKNIPLADLSINSGTNTVTVSAAV